MLRSHRVCRRAWRPRRLSRRRRVKTFGTMRQLVRERDAAPKVVLADVLRAAARARPRINQRPARRDHDPGRHGLAVVSACRGRRAPRVIVVQEQPRAGRLPGGGARRARAVAALSWSPRRCRRTVWKSVLAKLIAQHGLGGKDVAFRVDGKFTTLTLAIVDGRKLPPGARSPDAMKQAEPSADGGRRRRDADRVLRRRVRRALHASRHARARPRRRSVPPRDRPRARVHRRARGHVVAAGPRRALSGAVSQARHSRVAYAAQLVTADPRASRSSPASRAAATRRRARCDPGRRR